MSHLSSPREEFENVLPPLANVSLERELPLGQRLWQQGWIRKGLILILLAVLWAFLHHTCAGVRYLLMDVHVGGDLPAARLSAKLVLVVSLLLTAVIGVWSW